MLRGKPGAAAAKMAGPCAWARGMNLYGIAAIPWFPSEVLKLATSDVQQPLGKSPKTLARSLVFSQRIC